MRSISLASAFVAAIVLSAPVLSAQVVVNQTVDVHGEPMQLPGMGRQFKAGTGRISGRIVNGESGAPLRRAQVRLSGAEIGPRTALTDAEGRFAFSELPAGRFTLNATKSGFVTIQYGQTRPFESGKTIDLADAQVLDRADIAMPRGSVIAGRIVDEFGEAMPDATVRALRSTWSNGRRRLQATGRTAVTNDLGQYRLFGLPPGEYYVSATLSDTHVFQVEMALAAVTRVRAGAASSPAPTSGYAPTYYPGTTTGAQAQRITLTIGQEMQSADFALSPVRLAKVSGTVINSQGTPVEGTMVNVVARNPDVTGPLFSLGSSGRTDKHGNFTISGVAPGDYILQTRGAQILSSSGGRTMVFAMREMRTEGDSGGPEVGSVPISVSGDDLTNVLVMTARGGTATGSVVFEGGQKPQGPVNIRIMATPFDADGPAMMMGGAARVHEDGSFELSGLAGGRIIRPANLPSGWTLKAVRLNGQDITDSGAEFKAGQAVTGLDVVLTSEVTEVAGTVTDGADQPVKDYTVVIFSDDPERWVVPRTRHVAGVRPDQDGRFQLRDLPPGRYYAVAVDYIEQGAWGDPEVLQQLKPKATSLTLDEGDTQTLNLKISR